MNNWPKVTFSGFNAVILSFIEQNMYNIRTLLFLTFLGFSKFNLKEKLIS